MTPIRRILFIMCDQLRWDYLSCNGHPALSTPHIDSLAARGVNFKRAYAAAPICGPSRMSFYSGRYVNSHGCYWNGDRLRAHEWTLPDYLRQTQMRTVLVGKSDIHEDTDTLQRLGLSDESAAEKIREGGFELFDRDDGIHPDANVKSGSVTAYNRWLAERGYSGDNPWHHWANSVVDERGDVSSGWLMKNTAFPARVDEVDSETSYQTMRAMEFMRTNADGAWCLHLSYNKPHWPYIAPAPYHGMYRREDVNAPLRAEAAADHPVQNAFMQHPASIHFSDEERRATIVSSYMGLVKQLDDHIGKLLTFIQERNWRDDTMLVFTADHGDYLGDYCLGEKYLLHDAALRIPLIIVDPRRQADGTRGDDCHELVEGIDICPTLLDAAGGQIPAEKLEGRSLLPLLHGQAVDWRRCAFAESNYSGHPARQQLDLSPADAHCWMAMDGRYKYILHQRFPPQLFDLREDPDELHDKGRDADAQSVRDELHEQLFAWFRRPAQRTTVSDADARARARRITETGIRIGWWDENG